MSKCNKTEDDEEYSKVGKDDQMVIGDHGHDHHDDQDPDPDPDHDSDHDDEIQFIRNTVQTQRAGLPSSTQCLQRLSINGFFLL